MQRVEKPWGYELIWARTPEYVGKKLVIRKGHKLSLQYHRTKEETIYLHSGLMTFTVGGESGPLAVVTLRPGESYHIPPGLRHRMEAVEDCEVFEVSTPHLDDVVRLEDAYGRAEPRP
ncbi:MAG TPA: cupin domain-containing protein [Candidatus Polarisedimenticolia bacterium]|nr:cupin domain-containing protein [Candidatus Polarisedimenticolia bacterium]